MSAIGRDVRNVEEHLLPVLDAMAKRVIMSELEAIRRYRTKLKQLANKLEAVRTLLLLPT